MACKELKIAHIAQLNQLFQFLHLNHIYGQGFFELSGNMLMRKNVDNDVSKDSPIARTPTPDYYNNADPRLFSKEAKGNQERTKRTSQLFINYIATNLKF